MEATCHCDADWEDEKTSLLVSPWAANSACKMEKVPRATAIPIRSSEDHLRFRKLGHALSVFGWSFDVFVCIVTMLDILSDILVGVQMYSDGHFAWAWIVFACFVNSNIFYTGLIVQVGIKDGDWYGDDVLPQWFRGLPTSVLFVLLFPFAQLFPVLHWAMQTFFVKFHTIQEVDATPQISITAATRVAREEARAVERSAFVMGRLAIAAARQARTHAMFIAETVVEAVPQSIIQLLAITMIGNPSTLQIVSMVLSLTSIISKCYCVSLSCDVKVFVAKMLIISHDVLSIFYVICSVLSSDDPHRSKELFPDTAIWLSPLGYAWMMKELALTAFFVTCGVGTLLFLGVGHLAGVPSLRLNRKEVLDGLLLCIAFILGFIPGMLLLETAKLSLILAILKPYEPEDMDGLSHVVVLFSFLKHRSGMPWGRSGLWRGKMKHLYHEAGKIHANADPQGCCFYSQRWSIVTERLLGYHHKCAPAALSSPAQEKLLSHADGDRAYSHWNLARYCFHVKPILVESSDATPVGRVMSALLRCFIVVMGLSATFSFIFPFANFATSYSTQNGLQKICFYGMLGCLIASLSVAPTMVRYIQFCLESAFVLDAASGGLPH